MAISNDEYVRILIDQNKDIPCPHCKAPYGHYVDCDLFKHPPKGIHTWSNLICDDSSIG